MSWHLFSTPVQCPRCGATVDDPQASRCPQCGALLRERRTPARLAGVERRYGGLRVLIGLFRLLGGTVIVVGLLMFLFGLGQAPRPVQIGVLLGALINGVALLAAASVIHVVLDIEENTRASFRVQQRLLELAERGREAEG